MLYTAVCCLPLTPEPSLRNGTAHTQGSLVLSNVFEGLIVKLAFFLLKIFFSRIFIASKGTCIYRGEISARKESYKWSLGQAQNRDELTHCQTRARRPGAKSVDSCHLALCCVKSRALSNFLLLLSDHPWEEFLFSKSQHKNHSPPPSTRYSLLRK